MSRRRLNSIASLIDGFNAGYSTVGNVLRDRDLAKVAQAKPEEVRGEMPAANPEEVQRLTDAGGGYPEAGPINAATGGPRAAPKYALLGVTQDTPFTPDQEARARQSAQAGVLEKHGDLEGAGRVRDRIAAGELRAFQMDEAKKSSARADQTFEWQKEDRERQRTEREAKDAYEAGRREIFSKGLFGQRAAAYAREVEQYQRKQAEYDDAVNRGDTAAIAPTKPTPPTVGPAEMLADAGALLLHDASHGKATPESLMAFGERMRQSLQEGQVQAMRMAQGEAPLTEVLKAFNSQGSQKIDPDSIVSDKMVDRGNGVKTRIIKFRQEDGSTAVIDTLAGLDAFKAAGDYFERAHRAFQERLATNADRRAGAAEGRAAATFNAGAGTRAAEAALGAAQAAVINAKTPEERTAATERLRVVREGLSAGAAGTDDKNAPSEVKLARAAINAGMFQDMGDALRWATSSKGKSPAEVRASLYEKALTVHMGDAKRAKESTDQGMSYLFPQGVAAPGVPAGAAPADVLKEARDAVARGANKDEVNKRLQAAGLPPL